MRKANLHEAKTHLSKLVELVGKGEEVVICKSGIPIARLIPYNAKSVARTPGGWEKKVRMRKDFDDLPDDFMRYFK